MAKENNDGWQSIDELLSGLIKNRDKFFPVVEYENETNYFKKLKLIARYYRFNESDIIKFNSEYPRHWYHSYPIDWTLFFTPIEMNVWGDIRSKGVVMYPQYPALNYHLDFANPAIKVGVEVDGAEYHKNKEKDKNRDSELSRAGWTIFRITGKESVYTHYNDSLECSEGRMDEDEADECIKDWIFNSGNGIITAIDQIYFRGGDGSRFTEICKESLQHHCLTNPIL